MDSRNPATLVAALALLAVVAACGDSDGPKAASDPTTSSSAVADPDGPVVELLDAGAEPRAAVRLQVEEGDVQRSTMTMQTQMSMTIDGEAAQTGDLPPVLLDTEVTIDDVRDDGIIESSFTYDGVRVDGTGVDAEQMESALEAVAGISGTLVMTDTGAFVDGDLDLPDDLDGTMRTTMESFETQMSNFTIPLPTEELGVGARWTVTTQTALNGIEAVNVATYELVERDNDVLALDVDFTTTAPEQDPEFPGLPPGESVHLVKMAMAGSGQSRIRLDRLLPLSSSSTIAGDVTMTIEAEGETSTMLQKMTMRMELAPR